MSDESKVLEILIRTKAELEGIAGADKAIGHLADQITNLQKKQKFTGEGSDELSEAMQRQVDASKLEHDALEGTGKAAEHFGHIQHELREVMHHLSGEMPIVGELVRNLINPYFGLTLAISAVIGKMFEYQQEMKAMVNRPGPDFEGDAKMVEDLRQAYADAAISAAQFGRELERLTRKPEAEQSRADAEIARLKVWEKAEEESLATRQKMEQDAIDGAEARGLITHQQALDARLRLDEEYERRKLALADMTEQIEIGRRRREMQEEQAEVALAKHVLPGQQKSADTAHAAQKRNDDNLETDRANLAKAVEEKTKLQEDIGNLQDRINHHDTADLLPWIAKQFGMDVQSAAEAQKLLEERAQTNDATIADLRDAIKRDTERGNQLRDQANAADETLSKTRDNIKALLGRIHELNALLPHMSDTAADASRNRGSTAAGDDINRLGTVDIGGGHTGADIGQAALLEQAQAHGQKLTAQQQQFLTIFETFMSHTIGLGAGNNALLKQAVDQTRGLKAEQDALKQLVDQFRFLLPGTYNR